MSTERLLQHSKLVLGLAPSADRYNTSPATDFVCLQKYESATFVFMQVATTGQATVTIEASAVAAGTSPEAVAGRYRKLTSASSPIDSLAAEVEFAAAGFSTGVSETGLYAVEVRAEDLPVGKPFVGLRFTEAVDAAVVGACFVVMDGPRYRGADLPSAIS